jgi:hypothetical protein
MIGDLPISELTSSGQNVVFEDPGTIIAHHGFGCAESNKSGGTVKNQGNENAAASKTTVTFGDIPLTLDTPPIPAGGSVDLLFKVPLNCFSPDCSLKIMVDSNNQVNEGNNEGNNSANGGCIG